MMVSDVWTVGRLLMVSVSDISQNMNSYAV